MAISPGQQHLLAVEQQEPIEQNQRVLTRGINLSVMCDWVYGLKPPFAETYQEAEQAGTLTPYLHIFYLGEQGNYTPFEGERAEAVAAYLASHSIRLPLQGAERGLHPFRTATFVSSIRKAFIWVGPYKVTAQRGPAWYSDFTIMVQLGDAAPHLTENKKNVMESEAFLQASGIEVATGWLPEEPEAGTDDTTKS